MVRPPTQQEFRAVLPIQDEFPGTDLDIDIAYFVDRETKRMTKCMPMDFEHVPLPILCEG